MQDLKITTIQGDLTWQDCGANKKSFETIISSFDHPTDMIILPEMFTTGFTMDVQTYAEEMEGPTMTWMAKQADNSQSIITGSIIIKENTSYYNRLIWMYPGGMYQTYDKRHLFAMAGEDKSFTQGEERLIIQHKGWRICPMICYDLRFPVWSRNDENIDLLIYIANWPDKRSYDWMTLLRARAIENQCYVIGVNRVGTDANGYQYNGDTCVIDPGWRKVIYHHEKTPEIHTTVLSVDHLAEVRKTLPFLEDRDDFKIM